jgi:hypothetical protein
LTDAPSQIESQIQQLAQRLQEIEQRLDVLEASRPDSVAPAAPTETLETLERPSVPSTGATLALIGRTLVVLGGGFLLRAITEADVFSRGLGTTLGIAYAILWILLAERDAARQRESSATFHGLAGAIIAFPLFWESTVRYDILPAATSAAFLMLLTAIALTVAWRRGLRELAWTFTLGYAFTALGLAFVTKAFLPFVAGVLLLGLVDLWLGYVREWHALAWFTAALSDASILLMTTVLFLRSDARSQVALEPVALMLLQLSLVVIYVGSFAGRTLARGRDVGIPESLQSVIVLAIGLGGALATLHVTGSGRELLAAVSLGLGAGGYAIVFSIIDKRLGSRTNFIFFSTLALVFTVVGIGVLLTGTGLVAALSIAALFTAWLGAYKQRATLSLHGAVYAVTAASVSGVLARAIHACVGPAETQIAIVTLPMLLILGAASTCCALPVALHGRTWGRLSRLPKLALITIVVMCLGAILVSIGARLLPSAQGAGVNATTPDPALVGSLRTAVLAFSALVLAAMGRWKSIYEATLLVYPILVFGGLKLLVEDLRTGRPVTLFVSLVIYGSALIFAPRLVRRGRTR